MMVLCFCFVAYTHVLRILSYILTASRLDRVGPRGGILYHLIPSLIYLQETACPSSTWTLGLPPHLHGQTTWKDAPPPCPSPSCPAADSVIHTAPCPLLNGGAQGGLLWPLLALQCLSPVTIWTLMLPISLPPIPLSPVLQDQMPSIHLSSPLGCHTGPSKPCSGPTPDPCPQAWPPSGGFSPSIQAPKPAGSQAVSASSRHSLSTLPQDSLSPQPPPVSPAPSNSYSRP